MSVCESRALKALKVAWEESGEELLVGRGRRTIRGVRREEVDELEAERGVLVSCLIVVLGGWR